MHMSLEGAFPRDALAVQTPFFTAFGTLLGISQESLLTVS